MDRRSVSATITAQNTFTDPLRIYKGERGSISVAGNFSGTVTLERRLDGQNWRRVDSWTAPTEKSYYADESVEIRIGVRTGDFTSGSVEVRLGR